MTGAEHRHHPRTFFDPVAGITADFESVSDGRCFPAVVMNASIGGIGVATRETLSGKISRGDQLTLKIIKVRDSNTPIRGIPCVVQWVLEEPASDKLTMGMEFPALDPVMRGVLQKFVESAPA